MVDRSADQATSDFKLKKSWRRIVKMDSNIQCQLLVAFRRRENNVVLLAYLRHHTSALAHPITVLRLGSSAKDPRDEKRLDMENFLKVFYSPSHPGISRRMQVRESCPGSQPPNRFS